jgi:hypothetical protein
MNATDAPTTPTSIRDLRKLPFGFLREAINHYKLDNPGFHVPIRSRAEAHLFLTDGWGQVRSQYKPYLTFKA